MISRETQTCQLQPLQRPPTTTANPSSPNKPKLVGKKRTVSDRTEAEAAVSDAKV